MAEAAAGVAPPSTPPTPGAPTPPPAGTPPAPAPAAAATPPAGAAPAAPFATFPDADSFNKRIQREAAKQLKDMGIDDPAEVKKILDARKEQERAQLTENERLKADLVTANAKTVAAETEAGKMRTRTHLAGVFAQKGVKNFDYGYFLISQKRESLAEGEEFDENSFLDELAKDPASVAALGMAAIAAAPAAPGAAPAAPANTSPTAPGATPTPAAANPAVPVKTVMDLTPDEWAAKKQEMGLAT